MNRIPYHRLVVVLLWLLFCNTATSAGDFSEPRDWESQRRRLVDELRQEGITDLRVLDAMMKVPRHEFIPIQFQSQSYENHPLPIGHGQTISQPYIVAYMCQALQLKPTDRVLEIGTGSGYHAAVMSLLAAEVFTIEIIPELGRGAEQKLKELRYNNVQVFVGDGYQGLPDEAPFDAVILTAAPPEIPQPLLDQLAVGGRLIAPVGESWQELVLVERTPDGYKQQSLLPVLFVPMTGKAQQEPKSKR
jgi:protein-L-isoaspartate(D-aspartate) O-methyltransferase